MIGDREIGASKQSGLQYAPGRMIVLRLLVVSGALTNIVLPI